MELTELGREVYLLGRWEPLGQKHQRVPTGVRLLGETEKFCLWQDRAVQTLVILPWLWQSKLRLRQGNFEEIEYFKWKQKKKNFQIYFRPFNVSSVVSCEM